MEQQYGEHEHATTGIRGYFVGYLADDEVWRCGRCHALIIDFEAHAEEHQRLDGLAIVLTAVRNNLLSLLSEREGVAPGVGIEQAQLANDHARERRIAGYRDAIMHGRVVHDDIRFEDSASVREVPNDVES